MKEKGCSDRVMKCRNRKNFDAAKNKEWGRRRSPWEMVFAPMNKRTRYMGEKKTFLQGNYSGAPYVVIPAYRFRNLKMRPVRTRRCTKAGIQAVDLFQKKRAFWAPSSVLEGYVPALFFNLWKRYDGATAWEVLRGPE